MCAKVNVAYSGVYAVENMAVVKYRSTNEFTFLVLIVLIIL